jgi:hypothetical protein
VTSVGTWWTGLTTISEWFGPGLTSRSRTNLLYFNAGTLMRSGVFFSGNWPF